LVYIYVCIWT